VTDVLSALSAFVTPIETLMAAGLVLAVADWIVGAIKSGGRG